ncbi:MAG: helix-turn-helix domain-containing protein [Steroidobacteraceae bacterium]
MPQSGAYGKQFGQNFGLEDVPVIVTRALRKAEIVVTEVRSENPQPRLTDAIPREDAFLIGLQLRDFPRHEYWEDGRQAPIYDLRAGECTFYDLKRDPIANIDKPYHSIHFYIPRVALNAIADDVNAPRLGELEYRPGAGVADNTILCLGQSMLAAFAHPQRASRLFVDHVTLAVATHVAQTYGSLKPTVRPLRGGLAAWQAKRAKEILSANLDGSVTLKDIAEECGLSTSHFSRGFRVSVGMAPHNWLLKRRVAHAKGLLANRQLSLSEVALACGFADQSHFTRVFSRVVGAPPGVWRRCLQE